jgi:hypothetical protein
MDDDITKYVLIRNIYKRGAQIYYDVVAKGTIVKMDKPPRDEANPYVYTRKTRMRVYAHTHVLVLDEESKVWLPRSISSLGVVSFLVRWVNHSISEMKNREPSLLRDNTINSLREYLKELTTTKYKIKVHEEVAEIIDTKAVPV